MSYATGTTHYNLPQTVGSDKRDWTDTNQAFSDIDAAIYGAAQGASAATSAIETINGEIETITGKQAVDEGNITTLSGKVSTLESTVGTQAAAIADVRQDLQDNIESKREASATSTHAYNIGDTFYYNDVLYKATAQIAIGGTIVPSTNCTAVTVMSELARVEAEIPSDAGYVEVTGDGTATNAAKQNELFALIDQTKITDKSKLEVIAGSNVTFVYNMNYRSSTGIYFSRCDCGASSGSIVSYVLEASASALYMTSFSSTGNTFNTQSSNPLANGQKLRVVY